jgi:hypothetical protein
MRTPYRVNPPPAQPAAPEPEPANLHTEPPVGLHTEPPVGRQLIPATPVQPDHVTRAAKALALQVWSGGTTPRSRFFAGQNETAQADTDRALSQAIDVGWVAVSGDQLVRGSVSPNPMSSVPDERTSHGRSPSRV